MTNFRILWDQAGILITFQAEQRRRYSTTDGNHQPGKFADKAIESNNHTLP